MSLIRKIQIFNIQKIKKFSCISRRYWVSSFGEIFFDFRFGILGKEKEINGFFFLRGKKDLEKNVYLKE